LDCNGLDLSAERFGELMKLDGDAWSRELDLHRQLFAKLDDRLPEEFKQKRELLRTSLERSPQNWTSR
ncbi:MAG: phosphoenolpyruvate carboxykinase, partial [Betaproteobacteria bacterium]